MNEELSRLMDGDLIDADVERVVGECRRPEALTVWACYHIIGDVLRGTHGASLRVASRVSEALATEPTVLAPRMRSVRPAASWAWAAAATVAAVTVVGWTAYSLIDSTPGGIAKAREAGTVRAAQIRPLTVPPDYLLAHQEYAPANALQSVGPYLRDVAASPLRPAVAE